ncbi:MAG: AI-2E family transporter [Vicinamibacterales bacterium]
MAGFVALIAVLLAALYVCWLMFQPFFNVLLWAAVLSVVFYPMHRRILARTGKPSLAAACSTLLVILLILLPVTFITVAVVRELSGAASTFKATDHTWANSMPPGAAWILDRLGPYVDIDRESARTFIADRMQTWGTALAASTLVVVGGAVGAIAQMLLVVFTLFYFFRDGERIRHAAYEMVPLQRVQWHDIIARTKDVIGATVYDVLAISAIQGTLGTFIFWSLGLPSPLLWGVVMFFLSMIPMAGAFLVWVPAGLPARAAHLFRGARRTAGLRCARPGAWPGRGGDDAGADRDGPPGGAPAVGDPAADDGDGGAVETEGGWVGGREPGAAASEGPCRGV